MLYKICDFFCEFFVLVSSCVSEITLDYRNSLPRVIGAGACGYDGDYSYGCC